MKSTICRSNPVSGLGVVVAILLLGAGGVMAQSVGDFRSVGSGNWNSTSSWQRFNGLFWASGSFPEDASANAINIHNGHTVTVTAAVTSDQVVVQSGGQLTISSGVTFTVANGTGTDLTVAGLLQNSGTVTANGSVTVNSGGTLNCGTGVMDGAGTFTLSSGGTLGIGSAAGITQAGAVGNIQTTTRSFSTGGNYVYNGLTAQQTGSGLPATVHDLTIDNGAGVTLDASTTVSGTGSALTLQNGVLSTGENVLALAANGSISGGSATSYVNGNIRKQFNTGAGQSFNFPVGDVSQYAPVNLAAMNVTTAGNLTAKATAGDHPQLGSSGINPARTVNRYWTLTNSPGGIVIATNTVTFNFAGVGTDVDAAADPLTFGIERHTGSWTSNSVVGRTATNTVAAGVTVFGDFAIGNLGNNSFTTNVINFNHADRAALLADGWDFLARTAGGQVRNTETSAGTSPPDVSYDQVAHPGVLRVPMGNGDLWATENNTANSLFRNLSSNWVSVRLDLAVAPTANFQQAHLALYQDDDNYVEIGHGYNGSVGGKGVLFVMENGGVQQGSPRIINRVSVANTNVYLRLDRNLTNDFVAGLYSHDGTNWISLGEVSQEFINPRLCIWTGGSTSVTPLICSLRRLDILTSDTPLAPLLVADPGHLVFQGVVGEAYTNRQQLRVIARRAQTPVNWTLTPDAPWLSVSAAAGTTPAVSDVSVDTTGLAPGIYNATLSCAGTDAVSATTSVTLIINPVARVRTATWRGGSKGAMSVSVDDSRQSGFAKLNAAELKGTYYLWGLDVYTPFAAFYAAGMELGGHTVNHLCFAMNEPRRRYEVEANLASMVAGAGVSPATIISFAWPCGLTTIKDQVIAADYFLSARGYNFNELEEAHPQNWMNLKGYNSHENNPHELNPAAPPNPADLKTVVDAAEAQGKWFNLVLHTMTNDDDAIPYSRQKDLWVAPVGSVVKYMHLRDRTVITNYTETTTNLGFSYYRLPLAPSRLRSFETAIHSNDQVTIEVDITSLPSVGGLVVGGVGTPYRVRDVAGRRLLHSSTAVTTNLLGASLAINDGTPVAVDQRITLPEDGATNLVVFGTSIAGHSLAYEIIDLPANGGLTGAAPNLTYAPATNFHGVDAFTFRITDEVSGLAATGLVQLAISSVNDAPVVLNPFPNQQGTYGNPFLAYATNVFWDVDGGFLTSSATGLPPGITINTAGTISGVPSQAGNFVVQLKVEDSGSPSLFATNAFDFAINKSNAPVNLSKLNQMYDGTPRVVMATTVPPGLTVNLTYDGNTNAPIAVGNYEVIATITEANYTGGATQMLTVADVPLVITAVTVTATMDVGITWQSISNFTYELQYKDALDAPLWQNLFAPVTATGETTTLTNSVGNQPQRFYRILWVP